MRMRMVGVGDLDLDRLEEAVAVAAEVVETMVVKPLVVCHLVTIARV
jgi:hypothetical protein